MPVAERLSPLDASFLSMESARTPMHVGGLVTVAPPPSGPLDPAAVVDLVASRIGLVPRFRQKVRFVPGRLGHPVWVDDPDFDLAFHVRTTALPRPGTHAQLLQLVGRLQSRLLDRSRPLWELYVVDGLAGGRTALVTKTHHAMVDGIAAVDAGALLLDTTPEPRAVDPDRWRPAREPSGLELAASALGELALRPTTAADAALHAARDVSHTARAVTETAVGLATAAWNAVDRAPRSPLNAPIGEQRRYATAATRLADHKAVRAAHGATVNDVVLTVVAGALRRWLESRGAVVDPGATVRALVPVSVRDAGDRTAGNRIAPLLVDLPIGEPDPVARLARVHRAMVAHKTGGRAVGARRLVELSGLAPPALHGLGSRVGSSLSRRVFNLVVTNVPGPQVPLYVLGGRAGDMYPVVPLAAGQTVAIGVTSFDGGVYTGINADRDAAPDVDVLAAAVPAALDELVAAT